MKFTDIETEVIQIVSNQNGRFISAYQICKIMEEDYPPLWEELRTAYPSQDGYPEMGVGANKPYSPASFVAHALEYFRTKGMSLRKEYLTCEKVEFHGIKPGFTGNVISIWAVNV